MGLEKFESIAYIQCLGDFHILVGVYVDDQLVTKSYEEKTSEFKQRMMNMFKMIDLGLLKLTLNSNSSKLRMRLCCLIGPLN